MAVHLTGKQMFETAWPGVPWSEASVADKRMFTDHAASVTLYLNSRGLTVGGVPARVVINNEEA